MNLIFDLDGTLVNSKAGVLASLEYIIEKNNVEKKCALNSELIGPPLYELLVSVVGEQAKEKLQQLVEQFVEYYDNKGYAETECFNGIDELLEQLVSLGFKLFVATNKRKDPTGKIIELFSWDHFFDGVYSIDTFPGIEDKSSLLSYIMKNQSLSTESTIYIGDTNADRDSAIEVGVDFLMVSWGYGDSDDSLNDTVGSPKQLLERLRVLLDFKSE